MIKRVLASVLIGGALLAGCGKSGTTTACTSADPATEDAQIRAYNTSHGYNLVKDSALGIYYETLNMGSGVRPNLSSRVTVTYKGRLISNDAVFDSTSSAAGTSFFLNQVIVGWQRGIPLLRAGGSIRLIIPSAYAYGCQDKGTIPPNSPLYFDVSLLHVN